MTQHVTIVGSRTTPDDACTYLAELSLSLRAAGVVVRTGDAKTGADNSVYNPEPYLRKVPADLLKYVTTQENLEVYTANDARDDDRAMKLAAHYR
jgi:hypothetical protein